MGLSIKKFPKIRFKRGGGHEKLTHRRELPKKEGGGRGGLGQFADLRAGLAKYRGMGMLNLMTNVLTVNLK